MVDENEVIANIAVAFAERAVEEFVDGGNRLAARVKTELRSGFQKYIAHSVKSFGCVKTLIYKDAAVPIESIYVPLSFTQSGQVYRDSDILTHVLEGQRNLITGTAGGGKSFFLRHLNLAVIRSRSQILPVFFELKDLNAQTSRALVESIAASVRAHIPYLSHDLFLHLLRTGRVALLLDGYDEVDFDYRDDVLAQITNILETYPKAPIVITSRPDEKLSFIGDIRVFTVKPMTKPQSVSLLEKIDYDPVIKRKFINAVRTSLYKKHPDFLSSPLLTNMMLLTYGDFAEIPNKIHIFYQNAYVTLFNRHDASKGAYQRRTHTSLPIDEFQRIFAHFCMFSYHLERFRFDESELLSMLDNSIDFERSSASAQDFLADLLGSVCLMQRDGLRYVFAHRTFQEYFSAWFITRSDDNSARQVLNAVAPRALQDKVFEMAYGIDSELIERAWVIPAIRLLKKATSNVDHVAHPQKFFSVLFNGGRISRGLVILRESSKREKGPLIMGLRALYNYRNHTRMSMRSVHDRYRAALTLARTNKVVHGYLERHMEPKRFSKFMSGRIKQMDGVYVTFSTFPIELSDLFQVSEGARTERVAWDRLEQEVVARVESRKMAYKPIITRRPRAYY